MGSLCLPNGAPLRQPGQYGHLKKNFFCVIRITGIPYCLPTKSKTQALSILLGKTSAYFIRNKMFNTLEISRQYLECKWLTVFCLACNVFALQPVCNYEKISIAAHQPESAGNRFYF